jgi:uncharacterized membrane protein YkvA (DUF1232 family)
MQFFGHKGGAKMLRKWLVQKIAYRLFRRKASDYLKNRNQTDSVLSKIESKAFSKKLSIKGIWGRIAILTQLIRAWISGEYKQVPYRSILMIMVGLVYFLSPIDLIPDFIPGVGFLDDAAVLAFILGQTDKDLQKFTSWKQHRLD